MEIAPNNGNNHQKLRAGLSINCPSKVASKKTNVCKSVSVDLGTTLPPLNGRRSSVLGSLLRSRRFSVKQHLRRAYCKAGARLYPLVPAFHSDHYIFHFIAFLDIFYSGGTRLLDAHCSVGTRYLTPVVDDCRFQRHSFADPIATLCKARNRFEQGN
ncbi:unnamed protein product [Gongylonema pulchrum]|uniref:Uncharacterized protein n=1 Tax=Gongylonema pulchrum TaxID=637853 RepID=A0A183EKU9_9BILA|nr:unnamed protein product [Gongylonema pulchrum]